MPRLLVSTAAWGAMRILGNITRCAAKAQEVKLGRYAAKAQKLKLEKKTPKLCSKNTLLLLVKNLLLLSKERNRSTTKNLLLLLIVKRKNQVHNKSKSLDQGRSVVPTAA